jgi:hypothetical protein
MRKDLSKTFTEYLFVLLAALAIFIPLVYSQVFLAKTSDYRQHIQWAQDLVETPQQLPDFVVAHSGWQVLAAAAHVIFGGSWTFSGFLAALFSVLLSVAFLYWLLRKYLHPWLSGCLALALNLAAPLMFLMFFDHQMYFGYIWMNPYHNPTYLLMKPFTVLTFYFSIQALENKTAAWWKILMAALFSALGAFAKPNYLVCLLPALAIIALLRLIKKKPINWALLIFGIVVPQVLLLGWQFALSYSSASKDNIQMLFAPFSVMRGYSANLLLKFFLSIAFPLVVTCLYWKEAKKDIKMQVGWLGFGFGAFFTYFLAESGGQFVHGNYLWSGDISLFILFVGCILFLAEKGLPKNNQFSRWCILITGYLNILFGVVYYLFLTFYP